MTKTQIKARGCQVCGGELAELKSEGATMLVCKECKSYRNEAFKVNKPAKKKK